MPLEQLKWGLLFCKISPLTRTTLRRCGVVVTSSESRWLSVRRLFIMARVQRLSDEDHAMKVTCYLIWGLAIAVSVGLLVYAIFL